MAVKTDKTQRRGQLASVQLGKASLPKVKKISGQLDVTYATVVRWAIEDFDLDIFLSKRGVQSTVDYTQQPESATV